MKDEDSTPFEPVGDESLEARIVAWVLGDASAFEAVELERLCEERPELLVFRRRMQALHGLLTEDEAARPDEAWNLPADKRGKIEALFGEMHAAAPEVTVLATPKRRYQPWIRQTLIASAACLALAAGFHQVFKPQADRGGVVKMSQPAREVDFMPSGGGGGQAGFGGGSAPRPSLPASPRAKNTAKGGSSSFALPEPEASEGIASVGSLQGNGGLSSGLGGGSGGGRGDGSGRNFGPGAAPAKPDTTLATRDQEQAAPRVPSPAPAPTIAPGQFGSALGGRASGAPADRARGYLGSDDQIAWSDADVPPPAVVTGGNRSGDDAISRKGIDATLTNPDRPSARPTPAGPGAAAPPVDALAKNSEDRRFKFSVQDEGKKAQLADGPKGAKPAEKTMQDRGEIADAKKAPADFDGFANSSSNGLADARQGASKRDLSGAAGEPAPSGGVEGEVHIGASSDYIFRGTDQGHGLAEAGSDVATEAPKNDVSNLDTLRKLSGGDRLSLNGPDHFSELDVYGEVSKDHGFAAAQGGADVSTEWNGLTLSGGLWYGSTEDSGNPATPFGLSATTLDYRYSSSKGAPVYAPFQEQGPSELGLDGAPPMEPPLIGRLFNDGVKGNSANRADVAKAKSGPSAIAEEARYKLDADAAPIAAADPFAAPAPPTSSATPTPTGAGAKDQLADRRDAKPKVEITREFIYPTEAQPPELPNGAPQAADAGRSELAQREIVRRQAVSGKEAEKLLEGVAKNEPQEAQTKEGKDTLRDNPALTDEDTAKVNEIRKSLYMGEGNFNLGKYDEAKREFENVLRTDPYNSAARRFMARIASAKSDYYSAAYDHTRSELLMQVDKAWELETPDALKNAIEEQEVRVAQAASRGSVKREAKIEEALGSQEYLAAKGDYEQSQKQLEALRTKLIGERIEKNIGAGNQKDLGQLEAAVRAQENATEERLKQLNTVVRTKGIAPYGSQDQYRFTGDADQGASSPRETENKLEQEVIQLHTQIQALGKYSNDDLLVYAAGLDLPENITKAMYPQYLEQQKALSALKAQGLADGHPTVMAKAQELKNMKSQLDAGVTSLRETLTAQKELAIERLQKVREPGEFRGNLQMERAKLAELKARLAAATATPAKPKPAPVPSDETSATEEPFSTFSLHVSDASFKLAKAALDRGDRPSPDQIRIEEFYNAFDYGDPAPAPGEQVACAIEQGAHPVLPQRNIVRVAMRVGSSGRSAGQPLNLTVLLDNSGSMEREDRNAGLKAAVAQLASLLKPGDTVTLAGFSRTPHLLADRLPGAEAKKLIELVDKLPSEGGTNLEEALKLAGELAIQRRNPAAQNRIVLLTDGAANLGNAQPEELSNKVAELRQQGIAFDAAGICAGGLNDRMLEALTRNGNGRYYIVNSPADADANFARQLAGAFRPAAENVKVQVHFNPARVSRYKLIGFEKHRLNKEDFHNDKVDAAELAADEAGVALYQVETLPQGTGEIGEVSVRFRDTASGEMVERSWTIPHDEKTPAFDKASPSIQLATLAALAAEKLRGGPLADATDFSSLVPQVARVRAYYANSSRVGELVDMTGKLK